MLVNNSISNVYSKPAFGASFDDKTNNLFKMTLRDSLCHENVVETTTMLSKFYNQHANDIVEITSKSDGKEDIFYFTNKETGEVGYTCTASKFNLARGIRKMLDNNAFWSSK